MYVTEYLEKMDSYIQTKVASGVYKYIGGIGSPQVNKTYKDVEEKFKALVQLIKVEYEEYRKVNDGKLLFPQAMYDDLVRRMEYTFPHLYGTVKCHKPDRPMRPICSTLHWFSRPIQRIFSHFSTQLFTRSLCKEMVSNIDHVAKEIYKLRLQTGYVFVKFDVSDMYGNIDKLSLDDYVQTYLRESNRRRLVGSKPCLSFPLLLELYKFSMHKSPYMCFNNRVYQQLIGLPQGACDSAFLANLYMDSVLQTHYEELFINHRIRAWWKYMDDFLLYMPKQHVQSFKDTFERLSKLKLEIEEEELLCKNPFEPTVPCACPVSYKPQYHITHSISFLDYTFYRTSHPEILIGNYRKPTASARMIHSLSNTFTEHKLNTIQLFFQKVLSRSSAVFLSKDLHDVRARILSNGYSHLTVETIYMSEVKAEIELLKNKATLISYNNKDRKSRLGILHRILQRYRDFNSQSVNQIRQMSRMDRPTSNHPANYPITSHIPTPLSSRSLPRYYTYSFRGIAFSNFIRMAHSYFGIAMPVFSNRDYSNAYRRFFCNRLFRNMEEALPNETSNRSKFQVGLVSCQQCGLIFILSGTQRLSQLYDFAVSDKLSDISRHQAEYGHTIPRVLQIIRPVKNIDYAYLNTLYSALYTSVGLRVSNPSTLSLLPIFLRTFLRYISGYGSNLNTGLPNPTFPGRSNMSSSSNINSNDDSSLLTLLSSSYPDVSYEPCLVVRGVCQVGKLNADAPSTGGNEVEVGDNIAIVNGHGNGQISGNEATVNEIPTENRCEIVVEPYEIVVESGQLGGNEVVTDESGSVGQQEAATVDADVQSRTNAVGQPNKDYLSLLEDGALDDFDVDVLAGNYPHQSAPGVSDVVNVAFVSSMVGAIEPHVTTHHQPTSTSRVGSAFEQTISLIHTNNSTKRIKERIDHQPVIVDGPSTSKRICHLNSSGQPNRISYHNESVGKTMDFVANTENGVMSIDMGDTDENGQNHIDSPVGVKCGDVRMVQLDGHDLNKSTLAITHNRADVEIIVLSDSEDNVKFDEHIHAILGEDESSNEEPVIDDDFHQEFEAMVRDVEDVDDIDIVIPPGQEFVLD